MGRSGKLFAYMDYGIEPDILTTAKALGGGFPISAMLTKQAIAQVMVPGTHGTTYGGNPLACAVGNAAFDLINDPALLAGVNERHQWFADALQSLNSTFDAFAEIRGKGLLIGAELAGIFRDQSKTLLGLAAKNGLMLLNAGTNVLRFTPSLIIEKADVDEGMKRLAKTLNDFREMQ